MDRTWLDARGSLLTERCPLPLTAPFTSTQAYEWGVSRRTFRRLVSDGLVRKVLHGVYAVAQATDDTLMRASALGLVVPEYAVVADRTAAWLHGVDILPRTALTEPPPIQVVHTTDTRVRRPETDGRRRGLVRTDVTHVHGVRVTTALRTALDLGRTLWRYDALVTEIGRFQGFRGVRQLRALAPLGDARSESPGESALRLHWIEAGLPTPEVQFWIVTDDGTPLFRLDLADPDARYGAECDGEEFHTSEADVRHDAERRHWIEEHRGWTIEAFTKEDVYRRQAYPAAQLYAGHRHARRNLDLWSPRQRPA